MSLGILISLENYQARKSTLRTVHYACRDLELVKSTFERAFGLKEFLIFKNSEATLTTIRNELKFNLTGIDEDIFFYYAGHGFYTKGTNWLTVFDTSPNDIGETSLSLQADLISYLDRVPRALLFLDTCSEFLDDLPGKPRGQLQGINSLPLEEFVAKGAQRAVYLSCSPGEKAHVCDRLQHGIWTWHLTEALLGRNRSCLDDSNRVTDVKLRDGLAQAVPTYIRKNTEIQTSQVPFATISSAATFTILEIRSHLPTCSPDWLLDHTKCWFETAWEELFMSRPGFSRKSGNTVPNCHSPSADAWARRLMAGDFADEIDEIYNNCRKLLRVKGSQMSRFDDRLDCEFFSYRLEAGQDEEDYTQINVTSRIYLRIEPTRLPEQIDLVLPRKPGWLSFQLPDGTLQLSELQNWCETLEDEGVADLVDERQYYQLRFSNGSKLMFLFEPEEVCYIVPGSGIKDTWESWVNLRATLDRRGFGKVLRQQSPSFEASIDKFPRKLRFPRAPD